MPHSNPSSPTIWTNWPINEFHIYNLHWRHISPCQYIHVFYIHSKKKYMKHDRKSRNLLKNIFISFAAFLTEKVSCTQVAIWIGVSLEENQQYISNNYWENFKKRKMKLFVLLELFHAFFLPPSYLALWIHSHKMLEV